MRNRIITVLFGMAVILMTAFSACVPKADQQFMDSVKQGYQQADSSLTTLKDLQVKFAGLKNLIQAAPEEVKNASSQRLEELGMAADEYAQKVTANLEPYQQQIDKGKQLADDYASGKLKLDDAKAQFALLAAEYQGITFLANDFKTTYEQFDTEFKTLARAALEKSAPAQAPEKK